MLEITQNDVDDVKAIAKGVIGFPEHGRRRWEGNEKGERFKSIFGDSSLVIAALWKLINDDVDGLEVKHLLWALVFLKVYNTEDTHCCLVGWPPRKEFREKSWAIVKTLSNAKGKVVQIENRLQNAPRQQTDGKLFVYLMSDMTDCHINEPHPFDPKWFSKSSMDRE